MLYLKKELAGDCLLGIWKIDETKEQLLSLWEDWQLIEEDVLKLHSEKRQMERLAVRVLLKELSGKETQLKYKPSGKVYISGNDYRISVSHTNGYAAVILSTKREVSIDIEQFSDKVKRISSKFISPDEYIDPQNELTHLLLHWSAKETMFKLLDWEGIDLKNHFHICKFEPANQGIISAYETKSVDSLSFDIHYSVSDNFVLTWIM